MFVSQLLLFIVVLSVFSVFNPGVPTYNWWQSLGTEALMLLGIFALLRFMGWRQKGKKSSPGRVGSLIFRGQIISMACLLVFCLYFDFKALLFQYQLMHDWEIISALLLSVLFFLHLLIVWWAILPPEKSVSQNDPKLSGRLSLILPMVLPWYIVTFGRDLLHHFWPVAEEFLSTEIGYLIFIVVLLVLMVLLIPPLMKTWWRCRPLPEPLQSNVTEVLNDCGVKVRAVCDWPVLGPQALSAAIMGILPGLRYLLITPKLAEVLPERELEGVVAHEAGHVRHRHLLLYFLLFVSYIVVIYSLSEPLRLLLSYAIYLLAGTSWGADLLLSAYVDQSYWDLVLALPMLLILIIYLRFVLGFFMRHMERQADFFSLDFMQDPAPLAGALQRIARLSANNPNQPSWHHFSIAQRVQALYRAPIGRAAARQGRFLKGAALVLCLFMLLAAGLNLVVQKHGPFERVRSATVERLQDNPNNYMAQYLLAHQEWRAGFESQAIKIMREIAQNQPNNPNVLNDLAWFLLQAENQDLHDPPAALPLAQRAAEINPNSAAIWDTLAEAYYANQEYGRAVESSMMAIEKLHPTDDAAYFQERLLSFEKIAEFNRRGDHE